MNKEDLIKLKRKLPRGYRTILHLKTGVSKSSIDAVLRGEYNNDKVLTAAIALAEEHQTKLNSYSEKINSL